MCEALQHLKAHASTCILQKIFSGNGLYMDREGDENEKAQNMIKKKKKKKKNNRKKGRERDREGERDICAVGSITGPHFALGWVNSWSTVFLCFFLNIIFLQGECDFSKNKVLITVLKQKSWVNNWSTCASNI